MNKSMAVREQNPDRFYDVSHYDLMAQPLETLAGLWERMGVEFGNSERRSAQLCLDENPKIALGNTNISYVISVSTHGTSSESLGSIETNSTFWSSPSFESKKVEYDEIRYATI